MRGVLLEMIIKLRIRWTNPSILVWKVRIKNINMIP